MNEKSVCEIGATGDYRQTETQTSTKMCEELLDCVCDPNFPENVITGNES